MKKFFFVFLFLGVMVVVLPCSAAVDQDDEATRVVVRNRLAGLLADDGPPLRATFSDGKLRTLTADSPVEIRTQGDMADKALAVTRALAPLWDPDLAAHKELHVAKVMRPGNGPLVHVDIERRVDGFLVAGYPARVAMTATGKLVAVTGSLPEGKVVSRIDRLGPVKALRAAALKLEQRNPEGTPVVVVEPDAEDAPIHLRWGDDSRQLAAWRRWIVADDGLHMGWEVLYTATDGMHMWLAQIDGASGKMVRAESLTRSHGAHGLVFDSSTPQPSATPGTVPPSPNPPQVISRSDVSFGGDSVASPNGWVGAQGISAGNNVVVREDHDHDYGATTVGEAAEPDDGNFSFPLELGAGAPPITDYVPAVVTNLFYWTNFAHDRLYALGFDEAAGNFQNDNFGNGGLEGDRLIAWAQKGAMAEDQLTNNAMMGTPPDGFSPQMLMFIWGAHAGGWYTDSSLDAEIIVHEYMHGVTARMGRGWGGAQAGAMNEGNSDFMSLNLLMPEGIDHSGSYPVGCYSNQDFARGIRTRPYSTDEAINSHTFASLGHVGIGGAETHADGEIWVQVLWEVRERLIARHGDAEGRDRIGRLILDMLLLAPPTPSMLEARDALLLAEQIRHGGEDQDLLWDAFAERGFGVRALTGNGTSLDVIEDFQRPSELAARVMTLKTTIFEGEPIQAWVARSGGSLNARLTFTAASGDSETVQMQQDGWLWQGEMPTVRGVSSSGDGVLQVTDGDTVNITSPGAAATTTTVMAQHRYQLGDNGLAQIAGEEDLELVGDDETTSYTLPFPFPFARYGGQTINVSTNGLLSERSITNDYINSGYRLRTLGMRAVAPMWYDLRTDGSVVTNEGVFVAVGNDWVRFRWAAETVEVDEDFNYLDGYPVNVACTLYSDGRLLFEYGDGNTEFNDILDRQPSPTVGLGYGDGALLIAGYDEADNLGNAASLHIRPPGGFVTESGAVALWAGETAEVAFLLASDHAQVDVGLTVDDTSVARVSGAGSVRVPANQTRASLQIEGVAPGAVTATLSSSDGQAALLPVGVFRLSPTSVARTQVLTLAGPFADGDDAAEVTITIGGSSTALSCSAAGDGRQSFLLPADLGVGEATVTVHWNEWALPPATLQLVDQVSEVTVEGLAPVPAASGQRVMIAVGGGPATAQESVEVALTLGGTVYPLVVREVNLDNGSLLVDLPAGLAAGDGQLSVSVGGVAADATMTIAAQGQLPVQVTPTDGAAVVAGSRVVVAGQRGGGLSTSVNRLLLTAGASSWSLDPFLDTGNAVAFELPADLPVGNVQVTPVADIGGVQVSASSLQYAVHGFDDVYPPAAVDMRSTDLAEGMLEAGLDGIPAVVRPADLQLRIDSGARVRILDATRLDLAADEATFQLPSDMPGGLVRLAMRVRYGDAWTGWGRLAEAVLAGHLRVAGAASAEGYEGSVWRTDVTQLNVDAVAAETTVTFSGGGSLDTSVAAGVQVTLGDVVATLAGPENSGSLRVDGAGQLIVASRTFNVGDEGTFGQFLAGERAVAALRLGVPVELIGLAETDVYRTNLGLVNDGTKIAKIRVLMRDGAGNVLVDRLQQMAAGSTLLVGQVYRKWASATNVPVGRITLELVQGERVHAYASMIDGDSGDPTTIPPLATELVPEQYGEHELWIAAAAASEGFEGAQWRTDLVLANAGLDPAVVQVEFSELAKTTLQYDLAAGETRRIVDVVGAGGFGVEKSGALRVTSDEPVLAMARVYNLTPDGTYGQLLVGEPTVAGLRYDELGWLPMLAGPGDFRTNVGLFNPTSAQQTLRVRLFRENGSLLATWNPTLDPGEWRQLRDAMTAERGFARIELNGTEGPVFLYGSVIDSHTGDPTTVPLVR